MTNFFYYDNNGQRQGPINNTRIRELVAQGVILPETIIETETGQQGRAGKIRGLTFPETTRTEPNPFSMPLSPSAADNPFSNPPNPFNNDSCLSAPSHSDTVNSGNAVLYRYKCVSAPKVLQVAQFNDVEQQRAVANFAEIINTGCRGGWEYYGMEEIIVEELPGCLSVLAAFIPQLVAFLSRPVVHNMLIFRQPI
ncbi:MAG: DUF4339 domain-containing protein [Planctomycetaceae bacterium]|jgi:hypothetical protein|nr:DUF4339 domain-containing protein [Planctomycetaceae bacterium]